MDLATALARIRTEYLDDLGTTDRFSDAKLIPWLDEARERVWGRYCKHGGRAFERVTSGTTDANGFLSLTGQSRILHVNFTSGKQNIRHVNRYHARSFISKAIDVLGFASPGTPVLTTDAVWPEAGTLASDQSGLKRSIEELLLRETALYASVKDHVAYTQLRAGNAEAWKDLINLETDGTGTADIVPIFAKNIGWDYAPEQDGILIFTHE